ncbi:MAG: hypothetical protein E6J90_19560 [Deltaproteobacteria bacterium]|nr:MAG: hypothetical protein E6J90_19560 [Deltaproteobacteria bacterium]
MVGWQAVVGDAVRAELGIDGVDDRRVHERGEQLLIVIAFERGHQRIEPRADRRSAELGLGLADLHVAEVQERQLGDRPWRLDPARRRIRQLAQGAVDAPVERCDVAEVDVLGVVGILVDPGRAPARPQLGRLVADEVGVLRLLPARLLGQLVVERAPGGQRVDAVDKRVRRKCDVVLIRAAQRRERVVALGAGRCPALDVQRRGMARHERGHQHGRTQRLHGSPPPATYSPLKIPSCPDA